MATEKYRETLTRYLSTPLGSTTPQRVESVLRAIDPESFGLGASPSVHAIHAARALIESWHAEDAALPKD